MNELKNRGVGDVLIAVVDGLKGFPEAINAVFPQTIVQTCIVHLIRHSMDFASWKDRKILAGDGGDGAAAREAGGLQRSQRHHAVVDPPRHPGYLGSVYEADHVTVDIGLADAPAIGHNLQATIADLEKRMK
jgi:hypothetical protein